MVSVWVVVVVSFPEKDMNYLSPADYLDYLPYERSYYSDFVVREDVQATKYAEGFEYYGYKIRGVGSPKSVIIFRTHALNEVRDSFKVQLTAIIRTLEIRTI